MTAPGAAPKLPFWKTIGEAYRAWFRHFGLLIRISWLWMLLLVVPLAMIDWMQAPGLMNLMAQLQRGVIADLPPVTMFWSLLGQLLLLPALSSVAVAWHRLLLRDEQPRPGLYLRLDGIVTGYGVFAFLIGVMLMVPGWLTGLASDPTPSRAGLSLLAGALSIVALVYAARLSLVLPAKALAEGGATLAMAWRMTRGNTARLFFGYLLCILPWSTIFSLFGRSMFAPEVGRAMVTFELVVSTLSWMIFGMVSIGFLSVSYRHFTQNTVAENAVTENAAGAPP